MRAMNIVAAAAVLLALPILTTAAPAPSAGFAVGPQYDSTHVYVAPGDLPALAAAFTATFGGKAGNPAVVTVTPTPSSTISEVIFTPSGFLSVFGFKTPIPYPFGSERTGYLVTDMDAAVAAARHAGAEIVVAPFPDPIGRDALIRWPGGVMMQLYWHTTAPSYVPLATVPENRVYVSADAVGAFVADFDAFAGGKVMSDDPASPGIEIGRPGETYRRLRMESPYGKMTVLVTDGHLPWPYGREVSGYEVSDLTATLAKAKTAGAEILAGPYTSAGRDAAMVKFPGGYVTEIHAVRTP